MTEPDHGLEGVTHADNSAKEHIRQGALALLFAQEERRVVQDERLEQSNVVLGHQNTLRLRE